MRVYVETTIASYATAKASRDLVKAARQELTLEWWYQRRHLFEVVLSQVVLNEADGGDPEAADRRLRFLAGIPMLEITPAIVDLAEALIQEGALPETATSDAYHLATATVHASDYLLTWNFRHLANAERKNRMQATIMAHGYNMPVICTPEELMGEGENEK